jgi:hypothetical protein
MMFNYINKILKFILDITYIYWPIECVPKPLFGWLFELAKITYIYWPIECIPKLSYVRVFELARITYSYRPIESNPKKLFVSLLKLTKITYVYWLIQCIPNIHLSRGLVGENYLHLLGNSMHVKSLNCWLINVNYNVQDFKQNYNYILYQ